MTEVYVKDQEITTKVETAIEQVWCLKTKNMNLTKFWNEKENEVISQCKVITEEAERMYKDLGKYRI